MQRWFKTYRVDLLAGLLLWAVVAIVAGAVTGYVSPQYWPNAVTGDEWVVAILLLPWGVTWLLGVGTGWRQSLGNRSGAHMYRLLKGGAVAAVVVFLIDLLVRGTLGLGYKPF